MDYGGDSRMLVDRRLLKNLDWPLILVTTLVIMMGILMVFSATRFNNALTGGRPFAYAIKQLAAVIIGVTAVLLMLTFDYHISDRASMVLYGVNLVLLASVLIIGNLVNGAKSWIDLGPFNLQPSELSKIILIVVLARYLSQKESLSSFYDLAVPFAIMMPPLFLIMLQPDLGTAMVYMAILFGMLLLAGARPRHLGLIVLAGVLAIGGWVLLRHFVPGVPFLKDYQVARLTSFINPEKDYLGSGYNVVQATTAVGSGRFLGKGLFHSTQGRLGFLPEHHTDFIFAVFGEEFGFFGSFLLLCAYFFIGWRGLKVAQEAKDRFGGLVAGGIVCMFVFHLLVNVGMNMGIMPITGIPLPFFSYGGSSMMANLVAVGFLLNIWVRRLKIMF